MSRKTFMLAAIVAGTLIGSDASFFIQDENTRIDASLSLSPSSWSGRADEAHYAQRHPPGPSTLTGKPGTSSRDSDQIIL
jgi:hypothetical protein